ncbi:MAG TPA: BrnT family toxin [Terriglobales bacterium]|nr:BrnT family toxin [Terriglobales bacterium]
MNLEFTWDARKNRANQRKHGISFETAILVFDDPFHLSVQDREVAGEVRWQTIGMVNAVVFLVAHTVDDEGHIRVISARKATRREGGIYAEGA